jgi:hypothetical protein
MGRDRDRDALHKTTKLMDFLAEVTAAAERNPVRDIFEDETGAPDPIVWLDELPDGVRLVPNPHDDVILRLRPQRPMPAPEPGRALRDWIEPQSCTPDGPEPRLLASGPRTADDIPHAPPPDSVIRAFDAWSSKYRTWKQEQWHVQRRKDLYEQLEQAAKVLEQQDDEYEFVLAVGLLRWHAPDGERICRHLVTEVAVPKLDRTTAEVSVTLAGGRRRLEEREVLADQDTYQPDRGRPARPPVLDNDRSILDPQMTTRVHDWLDYGCDTAVALVDDRARPGRQLPSVPQLTASPALMVRPRSRVLLAEAYQRIAAALREPNAQVPVALTQLVVDTERSQRDVWLREQHAAAGDGRRRSDRPDLRAPTRSHRYRRRSYSASHPGLPAGVRSRVRFPLSDFLDLG